MERRELNAKRGPRIVQANKLTLERHTGRRPGRTRAILDLADALCECGVP
jgi:hypothetical protein